MHFDIRTLIVNKWVICKEQKEPTHSNAVTHAPEFVKFQCIESTCT